MKETFEHGLSKTKAKKILEKAAQHYRDKYPQYNPEMEWKDDSSAQISFGVKGFTLDADATVHSDTIDVEMSVPLPFRVFQKKAMNVIRREINKWIEKETE